jgi:quercetin dioxygenase-like cupin family protein
MKQKSVASAKAVTMFEGVERRTLAYNDQAMLCHIQLRKGAVIPLHHHAPVQIGLCASGRVRSIGAKPQHAHEVSAGDGYVMASNEPHGAEALEDSVLVEKFCPSRPEYADF